MCAPYTLKCVYLWPTLPSRKVEQECLCHGAVHVIHVMYDMHAHGRQSKNARHQDAEPGLPAQGPLSCQVEDLYSRDVRLVLSRSLQ